jgi:hypothetical protein
VPVDRVGDRTVQQRGTRGDVRDGREMLNDRIDIGAIALAQHAVSRLVVTPSEFAVQPRSRHIHMHVYMHDLERSP